MKRSITVKRVITPLILMISSILFAAILLEIGIRLLFFQPVGREMVPYQFRISKYPGVYFELVPGNKYTWKYGPEKFMGRELEIPVNINSLGFRDEEIPIPKPPGVLRILTIGDSFTMGLGVQADDTYPEKLEDILNSATHGNPRIEVVNAGVGGYNAQQELAFFQARGDSLEPDMVLLGVHVNDVTEVVPYTINDQGFLARVNPGKHNKKEDPYQLSKPKTQQTLKEYLVQESHLLRFLSGRKLGREKTLLMQSAGPMNRKMVEETLRSFKEECRKRDLPLLVAIFPLLETEKTNKPSMENYIWIQERCKDLELSCIPMGQALKNIPVEKLWVHLKDHHPNSRGHALYANCIRPWIDINNGAITIKKPVVK